MTALSACSSGSSSGTPDGAAADAAVTAQPDARETPDATPLPPTPLAVRFLGVQGWVLQHGDDVVLTAPLFTRASVFDVSLGNPVPADTALIDAGLAGIDLSTVKAIISGHAHYDHLLDVPHVMANQAPQATLYANLTARNILAALAPDRPPTCTTPAPLETIDRDRVIALDDPAASTVDYRNCPDQRPPGAPLEGSWVSVPGSHVRVFAICSTHPDQFLFFHFGPGNIDTEQCDVPSRADGWLEGHTLSFLIDFLDEHDQPVFRVYYQDAPTNAPIGHPPADVLADKAVDVALLCVGNYDTVANQPGDLLAAMPPRFALSGHWEDFFQPPGSPPQPIPFENLVTYNTRAATAMSGPGDEPLIIDGQPSVDRAVTPDPGTAFVVPPAP